LPARDETDAGPGAAERREELLPGMGWPVFGPRTSPESPAAAQKKELRTDQIEGNLHEL